MSRPLFVIAFLALIAGAVGAEAAPTKVKVVNGRAAPAMVMDQTVLQPVHGNASVSLEAGKMFAFLDLITPPPGKMVVIKYITIQAFVSEATANALLGLLGELGEQPGDGVEHYLDAFPPPISLNIGGSAFQQMLTQHVLLYSTGPVRLSINRGQMAKQSGSFNVTFSGYLVKAPK